MNAVHPLLQFVIDLGLDEDALRAAIAAFRPDRTIRLEDMVKVMPPDPDFMEDLQMKGWQARSFYWRWPSSRGGRKCLLVARPFKSRGEDKVSLMCNYIEWAQDERVGARLTLRETVPDSSEDVHLRSEPPILPKSELKPSKGRSLRVPTIEKPLSRK